jgi:hypothetical protein
MKNRIFRSPPGAPKAVEARESERAASARDAVFIFSLHPSSARDGEH